MPETNFFTTLGVQVHPLHPLATPMPIAFAANALYYCYYCAVQQTFIDIICVDETYRFLWTSLILSENLHIRSALKMQIHGCILIA